LHLCGQGPSFTPESLRNREEDSSYLVSTDIAGAQAFFQKPVENEELMAVIQKTIEALGNVA
jgi:hypothetical protein